MPLTWDYINKGEDTAPEILLQASGSSKGEQIMLFQILQGFYGNPVVLEGTSANGFASEVVIGFDNTGQVGINNVMNKLNDSSFKISWTNNNYREVVKEQTAVKIKSIMVDIPEWNLIKNLKPTLVVERYKPAKYRGLNSNQQREYRASGFRQSNEPGLPSEFILSKQSGSVNILQENYFNIAKLSSRGVPQNFKGVKSWQWLQFRIKLTVNGITYLSRPIKKIKMIAQKTNITTISYKL